MVTNVDETEITIAWSNSNGFEGNTPITEARVEYSEAGGAVQTVNIPGSNPSSYTVTGLNSFALHNISVALRNAVGLSEPVFISASTLSPGKLNSHQILWSNSESDQNRIVILYWLS